MAMDWTAALNGATLGILATHNAGKCPSIKQRSMRLTVLRLYHEHMNRHYDYDNIWLDPDHLKSPKLYLEYKRKD